MSRRSWREFARAHPRHEYIADGHMIEAIDVLLDIDRQRYVECTSVF